MTDSTTGDLERRVARALVSSPKECTEERWNRLHSTVRETALSRARAALEVHAEWLEEQGLVVSYDLLHEIDVTSAGLAELLRRGGKFVLPESHAESETAPNGPGHQKTP